MTARRPNRGWFLVAGALLAGLASANESDRVAPGLVDAFESAIAASLPKPRTANPQKATGPCPIQNADAYRAPQIEPEARIKLAAFSDGPPPGRARWASVLLIWSRMHMGNETYCMRVMSSAGMRLTQWPLIIDKWKEAAGVGRIGTGVMGEEEGARLAEAISAAIPQARAAAAAGTAPVAPEAPHVAAARTRAAWARVFALVDKPIPAYGFDHPCWTAISRMIDVQTMLRNVRNLAQVCEKARGGGLNVSPQTRAEEAARNCPLAESEFERALNSEALFTKIAEEFDACLGSASGTRRRP